MATLNVRLDAESAAFLERITRESGRSKSEVVRQALNALRQHEAKRPTRTAAELLAPMIGCWDSGGLNLSERTGERFAEILKEKYAERARRRRSPRRSH